MQQTLRQRLEGLPAPFYALMLSDVLSGLAMGAGYVAISWWVVQSGGARDMAWFGSITALVMLLSLPLTAPLGDRLPKNRLIGGGMLLATLSALLLALMAAMGWYRIGWVIAVESLAMLAWSIVLPSMLSIAAEMVPAARLGDALSLQKSSQSAGNLIGPVLGGGLMAATSPTLTLLAYAFLLVVAAAASLYVRVPPRAAGAVRSPWLEDIRSGLYARWRIPLERYWTLAVFITLVAFMPLVTTLLPVKLHALGLSAAWLGGCEAAISAGMLLGSLWFTHVLLRRFSRYQARTLGMLVCGVLMLVVALSDNPWLILACFAVMGLMFALNQLIGQTHRTLAVPENYRARFSAINVMLVKIGSMLGPALAGALLHVLPLDRVYLIFALLHLATVLPMLLLPGLKAFLELDHEEVKDWYWRHHPEAFRDLAAMPAAAKPACETR